MEAMGKLRTQKHNWRQMMIISFMFYVIVGDNEALDNEIEVMVNDTVSMHCYTPVSIDIQWHHNSLANYVYAGRKLRDPYSKRFLTGDDNGTHILIIPKVRSEDAGWYYCSEEISGRQTSSTHLTVLYSDPVCYSNMHPKGFIGPNTCNLEQENMTFNCVVSFKGTSPLLVWKLLNDNRTLNSSICEDEPNRRNCSLILTSDPIYDGSIFICQTTALMDSRLNCSTETIKILYFSSTYDTAMKYVNDKVNCSANSNLNVKYNWTLKQNNKTAFLSSSQTLIIQKPGIYQCKVNYSIRNYSCLSIVSVMNVNVESTDDGTISGTAALAIIFSIGFVFVVLCTGMFILIRKRRKRQRKNTRENKRREYERRENERIRNKIEGMYNDFVLEVDPKDVVRPLIQKNIISKEDGDNVLNKETTEDSCRALLDHLSSSFHREAFIVLKEALRWPYPKIVAQIDATDNSHVTTIQENEIIKDKVVGMYIDFTSEVDPKNITFDHLIQNRIVSIEEKQMIMNKDTAKERCRALLDHLFLCSIENAFIILREALKERYLRIVERIDASDEDIEVEDLDIADEGKQENERIRNRVVAIYEDFVSEVDPKKVVDFLIQIKIVNVKQIHHMNNKETTEDQCKDLLDLLFSCSKDNVFIILKEALKEHYPGIVELIESPTTDDEVLNNPSRRSTMRLESSIIVFGSDYNETVALKINLNHLDEVSVLQQLSIGLHHGVAVAVYCDSVFVTGIGADDGEIWRFDVRYSKWNKCASMIKGKRGHSVAFVDHILYVCGGLFDDVEAYDAIDDKCSVVGKLTYAVCDTGNCVPYKASLYIFGGVNDRHKYVDSVQVYNTKLNSCTVLRDPMHRREEDLRTALFKNYAIFLGKKSCILYNLDAETWEKRDQFKTDVEWFCMTVHNEQLFVIGGRDSEENLRDDVRYVPIANVLNDEPIEWKHHAKFPKPYDVYAFGKLEFLINQI